MDKTLKSPQEALVKSRKILFKDARAAFQNKPASTVRITDISFYDVSVISQVHAKKNTVCQLQISVPNNSEENITFELKTSVISSVYSKHANGFKVSLAFDRPPRYLLQLIHKLS